MKPHLPVDGQPMSLSSRRLRGPLKLAVAAVLVLGTGAAQAAPASGDLKKTDAYYADPAHPNISGLWRPAPGQRVVFTVEGKTLPGPDEHGHLTSLPYKPAWKAVVDARYAADLKGEPYGDPSDACWPSGTFADYLADPSGMKITETAGRVQLLFERQTTVRRIYYDGRKHLEGDYLIPDAKGDSIARWEGDTLVADTIGVRPEFTLGYRLPHSDQVHFVERFRRTAPDTLQIQVTITDPVALAKPVKATLTYKLAFDQPFVEANCTDTSDVVIDANLVVRPNTQTNRKHYGFDLPN